jgi:hypothetical protein
VGAVGGYFKVSIGWVKWSGFISKSNF